MMAEVDTDFYYLEYSVEQNMFHINSRKYVRPLVRGWFQVSRSFTTEQYCEFTEYFKRKYKDGSDLYTVEYELSKFEERWAKGKEGLDRLEHHMITLDDPEPAPCDTLQIYFYHDCGVGQKWSECGFVDIKKSIKRAIDVKGWKDGEIHSIYIITQSANGDYCELKLDLRQYADVIKIPRTTEYKTISNPKRRNGIKLKTRFLVFKRDSYKCRLCGISSNDGAILEIDHILAVANGGTDDVSNLWTLCYDCNHGKRDRYL